VDNVVFGEKIAEEGLKLWDLVQKLVKERLRKVGECNQLAKLT
jgi:hypothetical protein